MVQVDHLILAVPNQYRYNLKGRVVASPDYANTLAVADALLDTHELDFRISWR